MTILLPKEVVNPNGIVETTMFIPSNIHDNPIGLSKDPGYIDDLKRREPGIANSLLYGDWSVFAGQIFRTWNTLIHTCKPFDIPSNWLRWRAVDWGFAAPFCCFWFAQDPQLRRIYLYRELYKAGLTDPEQARMIRDLSMTEDISLTYADPSMWARKTVNEVTTSTFEVYANNQVLLTKADNDQASKIRKIHSVLGKLPDGLPGLQIFNTCSNVIALLPTMVYDPKNPEMLLQGQEDHVFDTLGYGLTFYHLPAAVGNKPPKNRKSQSPWSRHRKI